MYGPRRYVNEGGDIENMSAVKFIYTVAKGLPEIDQKKRV